MKFWLIAILLGFPILETWLLIEIGRHVGWWLLAWLLLSAMTGIALIKEARFSMLRELASTLQRGGSNISALIGSGRVLVAGMLFILPGVISDLIALALILLPHERVVAVPVRDRHERVIDGDFRRER